MPLTARSEAGASEVNSNEHVKQRLSEVNYNEHDPRLSYFTITLIGNASGIHAIRSVLKWYVGFNKALCGGILES